MDAGNAAAAARPARSAAQARAFLLLLVGTANGCGWDRAADYSGDRDEREDVGQGFEQRAG
jgi:hypothetical protein